MAGAELALPGERSGRVIVGRAGLLVALMVLFFLSGASGLIYQTLWLRLLALVFGVTLYAASAVLASFMAGLALGSLLAGRLSDRVRSPLRAFGLVELGVGVAALATPLALDVAERAYVAIYPHLPQSFAALTATRFALAFAVLLLPTTLMGATLPLVLKSSLLRRSGLGAQVGLLYGTNTAGAILGTVLAGFVLIGGVGITAAFRLAVANNLLIGLVALLLAARMRGADERPVEASVAAIAPATALPARTRRLILLVFALSGFASLALEIVWFRVFALFIQVTTYAFTTMLATVLLGIAVGSWLATPLLRWRRDSLLLLAACELAIGLAALLSFSLLAESYRLFNWIEGVLGRGVPVTLLAAFLAIFPTTLLLGVAFPLGLRLWAAGEDAEAQSGERIGLFYALNLGGAILGALVAGFLLLPRLGSRGSLIALAAVGLGSGLLLLGQCPPVARRRALALGLAALLAFVAIAPTVPDPFAAALASRHADETLLWREEGLQATVSVHAAPGDVRILYLDGLHQANDLPATLRVHHEIGLVPLALHPRPRTALVIGLGGGVTPGAMAHYPGLALDVIELSDSLVRGADWFRHVNGDVTSRPNVRVAINDGRNHLLLNPPRYDIITADIIRPHHAGAGNLYSVEYFRLAAAALRDDGMMVQWVDPQSEVQYQLILRTFLAVFPETTIWADGRLLVGTKRPFAFDRTAFAQKLADPAAREALAPLGLGSLEALEALYVAGPEEARRFAGPGPLLTDDRPLAEYFLSLPPGDRPIDLAALRGNGSGWPWP